MNAIPILIDTFTLNVSWLMTAAFPHGESCFSWLTELPLVQSKVSFSDGNIVFIYTYFCHLQHTGRKNWKLKYLVSFSPLLSRRKPERRRGRGRHLFVNWRSVLVKNLSPFPSDVPHEVAAERGLWGEWRCAQRTWRRPNTYPAAPPPVALVEVDPSFPAPPLDLELVGDEGGARMRWRGVWIFRERFPRSMGRWLCSFRLTLSCLEMMPSGPSAPLALSLGRKPVPRIAEQRDGGA